ncbi:unnamed protein product [Somion occarium]|uniref:Prephenate dehydratase domain-containing protein n=1 Tax=Somion occarium TaxID=3059160 RepID=A0ABP1CL95_9APHY
MSSEENLPKVAFLGPLGTYSHQCARNYFGENVEYVDYSTITKVFQSVGPEVPYALVPQENTIYGAVIETYDTLRLPEVGVDKFVRGERAISIQHCLVVRQGVQLKDVVKIVSHEQAFGQCTRFLQDNFPNAILEKRPSTAEAAQSLLTPEDDLEGERAAICSSVCTTIFDGLEVARSSIQNESENYTRFYVLSTSLRSTPPKLPSKPQLRRALVRIGLPAISNPSESSSRLTHHRPLHLLCPLKTFTSSNWKSLARRWSIEARMLHQVASPKRLG